MARLSYRLRRTSRPWLIPVLTLLILVLGYLLFSRQIAAWVGGQIITQAELTRRMNIVQFSYQLQYGGNPAYSPDFARDNRRAILDQLAEEMILLREAADLATAEEQNEYAESLLSWIRAGFFQGEDAALRQHLTEMNLTEADLREYFTRNLQLIRLREKVTADIEVTAEEAQAYYQANQASFDVPEMMLVSHILVDSRTQAESLLAELRAGADFAELAMQHSLDKESAARGGSLRWFERGEMVEPFEAAAFALEPGQLSGVVETLYGYHIIKAEGKEPARARDYSEVTELARQRALQDKKSHAWDEYRTEARAGQLILLLAR